MDPVDRLILELGRLPGVGQRSAARLAFHLLKEAQDSKHANLAPLAGDLANALLDMQTKVGLCPVCQNVSVGDLCSICANPRRDARSLCVVEGLADLRAVEACNGFGGYYHVLHGVLSPLDGIGPDDLRLPQLLRRVCDGDFSEVIIATNATVEGDATALYLGRLLEPCGVTLTRLASGVPMGGELEYLDQATLGRALAERRDLVS